MCKRASALLSYCSKSVSVSGLSRSLLVSGSSVRLGVQKRICCNQSIWRSNGQAISQPNQCQILQANTKPASHKASQPVSPAGQTPLPESTTNNGPASEQNEPERKYIN